MTAVERRVRMADRMTEAQFLTQVRDLALLRGWLAYHTHDSRRSAASFPDLVLVNPKQRRVIYAELKTRTGQIRPEQRVWLKTLAAAGRETALWRPADLDAVQEILRGRFVPAEHQEAYR